MGRGGGYEKIRVLSDIEWHLKSTKKVRFFGPVSDIVKITHILKRNPMYDAQDYLYFWVTFWKSLKFEILQKNRISVKIWVTLKMSLKVPKFLNFLSDFSKWHPKLEWLSKCHSSVFFFLSVLDKNFEATKVELKILTFFGPLSDIEWHFRIGGEGGSEMAKKVSDVI